MYNVIDLFCGCGGLSKGFELAGFNIVGGFDFNAPAIKTFNRNFPKAEGICCDLLNYSEQDISAFISRTPQIDVIVGGPPCQGFSAANRYHLEGLDPRNKLFFEFVKFVDMVQPHIVLIENVRGIITSNNGYAKDRIYEIFQSRGYEVNHQILNAAEFGVPQKRLRNFFIMSKGKKFDFASICREVNTVSVLDAIGELYSHDVATTIPFELSTSPDSQYRTYLRGNAENIIYNHDARYPAEIVQERISHVPQGGNWQDVPAKLWPSDRNNRHSSAYKRLAENQPSVTIDTGNNHSNYFHPIYNRIPTVREAARLQSFPDDFVFEGNRSEQYRQVGNAVPPLLAKHIADAIIKFVEEA